MTLPFFSFQVGMVVTGVIIQLCELVLAKDDEDALSASQS